MKHISIIYLGLTFSRLVMKMHLLLFVLFSDVAWPWRILIFEEFISAIFFRGRPLIEWQGQLSFWSAVSFHQVISSSHIAELPLICCQCPGDMQTMFFPLSWTMFHCSIRTCWLNLKLILLCLSAFLQECYPLWCYLFFFIFWLTYSFSDLSLLWG